MATSQTHSVQSGRASALRRSTWIPGRRYRVDIPGLLALLIAAVGLVVTALLLRAPAPAPVPAVISTPAVAEDDAGGFVPAVPERDHAARLKAVNDRYYPDEASSVTR